MFNSFKSDAPYKFDGMIKKAESSGIIYKKQSDVIDDVRNLRNLVHGTKYEQPSIKRHQAMDIMATMDHLIKDFSIKYCIVE